MIIFIVYSDMDRLYHILKFVSAMAEDLDVEAMLEAPYKKGVSLILQIQRVYL